MHGASACVSASCTVCWAQHALRPHDTAGCAEQHGALRGAEQRAMQGRTARLVRRQRPRNDVPRIGFHAICQLQGLHFDLAYSGLPFACVALSLCSDAPFTLPFKRNNCCRTVSESPQTNRRNTLRNKKNDVKTYIIYNNFVPLQRKETVDRLAAGLSCANEPCRKEESPGNTGHPAS